MAKEQRADIESITWTMLGSYRKRVSVRRREEVTWRWKEKSKNQPRLNAIGAWHGARHAGKTDKAPHRKR